MEPGSGSDAVGGRVAGGGGLVDRRGLGGRLGGPARVTLVSAPAGSGKTVLLRSWAGEAGRAGSAAWVTAERDERDPQRFWLLALDALRRTVPGSGLVRAVTAAPDLDGWVIAEGLLKDLAPLGEPLWLVVDDVHELGEQALRQLELLIMRAPRELRFVLAARHDVRLGLHRLRLEGELAELRADDLRFSLAEAQELFAAAGVELPDAALAMVHERTEGWAAGLRLAALALAGRPDPARFAAEFSGSERTVADYLLAEVLDRQDERVRRLLLRTSVLGRVNGELADLLTGGSGGEQVLQDLEAAGAFVTSLDASRSWFRYHQMFADLLRLELRRSAPGQVADLHRAASQWFAARGSGAEAIRHAQSAGDWGEATRLFVRQWPRMQLDGQAASVNALLGAFPAEVRATDAELAAIAAGNELARGSLETAERDLALAERHRAQVPEDRRWEFDLLLGITRLLHARQRGNPQAAAEEAKRLDAVAGMPDAVRHHRSEDLQALVLLNLGGSEVWTRHDDARDHLEQGVALARRIGRPFLELSGLANLAVIEMARSSGPVPHASTPPGRGTVARATEYARQAIGLAEEHGWAGEPAYGVACRTLGGALAWQGRPEEAEPWIQAAERTVLAAAEPAAAVSVCLSRAIVELARGRDREALHAYQVVEQLAGRLTGPGKVVPLAAAQQVGIFVRLGETGQAEGVLAGLDGRDRGRGEVRVAAAQLRLAQGDPRAAIAELAPVFGGTSAGLPRIWLPGAFLLEAIARDALSDPAAAANALEHALDLAEHDGVLLWFLLCPAPALLERQARRRTAHAALTTEILDRLAGNAPAPQLPRPSLPAEPLTESEIRVLRYLPTNLSVPEIARELSVSASTVKTHVRHLYAKLGSHSRTGALARARDLGLLAPVTRAVR